AWLLVRSDIPGRGLMSRALVLPYIFPAWTFALAWITIFKNRRMAGAPGILESVGMSVPDWLAYGPIPIIVTLTLSYFPLAFILISGALHSVDAQLEESAMVFGAPRALIMRRITMPILLPSVSSSALLLFSETVGSFGAPFLLGSPTKYTVLSTSLYRSIQNGDTGVAMVLTTIIVLLGVTAIGIDLYLVRNARRFVTISGKGSSRTPVALGAYRVPATVLVCVILFVSIVVPLVALLLSTITREPGVFRWDNFTSIYWIGDTFPGGTDTRGLFRNRDVIAAAGNSLRIVSLAAVLAASTGILIGYVTTRGRAGVLGAYLKQLSFLPFLVPTIGFGAAYLTLFAVPRGPVPALYGTMFLVVLTMAVKYLPFAARAGTSAMIQLGAEPEDAAMVAGAPWRIRFTRIVLPILKRSLTPALILPFISGMKELVLVMFLAVPGVELLTTLVLRYIDYGYEPLANALVLVIVGIITALTLILQTVTKTGLAGSLRGA
ncbi:MAG: ABC transporter permease, partial [Alkalispirochaeta sp.]